MTSSTPLSTPIQTVSSTITSVDLTRHVGGGGGLTIADKIALGVGIGIGIPTLLIGIPACVYVIKTWKT
jgi:hypothetical protein